MNFDEPLCTFFPDLPIYSYKPSLHCLKLQKLNFIFHLSPSVPATRHHKLRLISWINGFILIQIFELNWPYNPADVTVIALVS